MMIMIVVVADRVRERRHRGSDYWHQDQRQTRGRQPRDHLPPREGSRTGLGTLEQSGTLQLVQCQAQYFLSLPLGNVERGLQEPLQLPRSGLAVAVPPDQAGRGVQDVGLPALPVMEPQAISNVFHPNRGNFPRVVHACLSRDMRISENRGTKHKVGSGTPGLVKP